MVRSKAHANLYKLSRILYDTLVHLTLMPSRELATPEDLNEVLQGDDRPKQWYGGHCLDMDVPHDGLLATERNILLPTRPSLQLNLATIHNGTASVTPPAARPGAGER